MATTAKTTTQDTKPATMGERFTNMVFKEFGTSVSSLPQISDSQKALIQGYFICIDRALKSAEEERLRKNESNSDHKWDNDLPVTWQNVNLGDLALDVVHYAKMGLDMLQPNMLSAIPFKNNKNKCYDVTLMKGYNGIRHIATKYALEQPLDVVIEVVYSNDKFRAIKKGVNSKIESYEFEIVNPFDRGEIIGGFAYLEFTEPQKNKLIIMSMADIEKRKPAYASANFWGGIKKERVGGKLVDKEVEGWLPEMVRKTIIREAYSPKYFPIDPAKVDADYQHMKLQETRQAEMEAEIEIVENANTVVIDTTPTALPTAEPIKVNADTGEVVEPASGETPDF